MQELCLVVYFKFKQKNNSRIGTTYDSFTKKMKKIDIKKMKKIDSKKMKSLKSEKLRKRGKGKSMCEISRPTARWCISGRRTP